MIHTATPAMTALTRHRSVRRFLSLINLAVAAALLSGCQFFTPIADDADSGAFDPRKVLAVSFLVGGGLFLKSGGSSNSSTSTPTVGNDDGNTPTLLPEPSNARILAELNAYAMSVTVAFRQGGDGDTRANAPAPPRPQPQTLPIVEAQYNDPSGNPQILTQHLEFAALGVWVNGDATATAVDGFQYASLADNVVVPPTTTAGVGTAIYDVEGDAVYRGLRFYPDGIFTADFNMGAMGAVGGTIVVRPGTSAGGNSLLDDFGTTTTPTRFDGTSLISLGGDPLFMRMRFTDAPITADGFSASNLEVLFVSGTGVFFSPVEEDLLRGQINGRFHAGTDYVGNNAVLPEINAAPPEISGTFSITDTTMDCGGSGCELKGGFLGDLRGD